MRCALRLSFILALLASQSSANDISSVILPVSFSLSGIAEFANSQLPATLIQETSLQRCVEPQKACTKIPEFRGFKIYSRMECVQVTPGIDCAIDQKVARQGTFSVQGRDNTLVLQQDFRGSATVRGRGEIGRHIRETAEGALRLTVRTRPAVGSDWAVTMPVFEPGIQWLQTPTAVLFNFIPVTFQSKADGALNSAIANFRSGTLPTELAKIDLRSLVDPLWRALQEPMPIALPTGQQLFFHFRPEQIGLEPLTISDGAVKTRIALSGRTRVTDTAASPFPADPTEVPDLSKFPPVSHLALTVPVKLKLGTLNDALNEDFPQTLSFDRPIAGRVTIRSANLEHRDGKLLIRMDTKLEAGDSASYDGSMTLSGYPKWNTETATLVFEQSELSVDGNGMSAALLNMIAGSSAVLNLLSEAAHIPLAPVLSELQASLDAALDRELLPGLRTRGDVTLAVTDVLLGDRMTLILRATGDLRVDVLTLR